MENNKNLTDEELMEFLKKIGYSEEIAKELLNNKVLREKYLPQYFEIYKDKIDNTKHR